jgi:hypothetical protein
MELTWLAANDHELLLQESPEKNNPTRLPRTECTTCTKWRLENVNYSPRWIEYLGGRGESSRKDEGK